jgi:hypothetical protein
VSGAGGFVAVLVIDLHFADAGSLKGKRKELSSIKAVLRGRLGVSVAEVEHHDKWQRATLMAAITGGSLGALTASADRVERWLEARVPDGVRIERLVASVEELRA